RVLRVTSRGTSPSRSPVTSSSSGTSSLRCTTRSAPHYYCRLCSAAARCPLRCPSLTSSLATILPGCNCWHLLFYARLSFPVHYSPSSSSTLCLFQ
ncbi:hypothetical protein CSUI_011343, partial [Cystoisospora suis]